MDRKVVVVGGCRTPFVKAGGVFQHYSALDLGVHVVDSLLKRLSCNAEVEELAYGTVLLDPRLTNAAREVVLQSSLPNPQYQH